MNDLLKKIEDCYQDGHYTHDVIAYVPQILTALLMQKAELEKLKSEQPICQCGDPIIAGDDALCGACSHDYRQAKALIENLKDARDAWKEARDSWVELFHNEKEQAELEISRLKAMSLDEFCLWQANITPVKPEKDGNK